MFCSCIQLYSLKKSIATLIKALSEENPPEVKEDDTQTLSGVSTLVRLLTISFVGAPRIVQHSKNK